MADDWAWPALISSLQRDIEHLRGAVDEMRRETGEARERHRNEIDRLIDQLRSVRSDLDPILDDRKAAKTAKREIVWGWVGRGGWFVLAGIAAAVWHWLSKHTD